MRFRIGAFLQAVLMLLMMCVPAAAAAGTAGITVTLDKTSAASGESVTASGTTEPGAWVPLKVIDEYRTILVFDAARADANGNYSIGFKVPPGARGTLTVVVGELSDVANATLDVVVPVTGVSIAQGDQVKLKAGETIKLTAVIEPDNATNKTVTWSVTWFSGNKAVVTVDQNGSVTAQWPGRATITVTTLEGSFTDWINIVVTGPPVKKPTAWPPGGAVVPGTQATLRSATEGADIYYTIDGTAPTAASMKYTGPITISEPVTIKAIAVIPDVDESEVLTVAYGIAEPIAKDEIAVDRSKKNLAVTKETAKFDAVKVSVPDDVKDATISVTALLNEPDPQSDHVTTDALPALNIEVTDTSVSSAAPIKVSIPKGTLVTAPEGWNGTINVPRVESAQSVTVDPDPGKKAKIHSVIEIGYGNVPLTFSKAVRLLIPGQAGKEAGYYRSGKFTKIPSLPSSARDDQDWADQNLPAGGDGKMDAGSDLVVWTKHFTKFVTYRQTSVSTGGGGDSGGGVPSPAPVTSTTGAASVTPAAGGAIGLGSEAAIVIPADALTGTGAVEVKIEKVSAPPAAPAGFRPAGSVYEFTVDGKPSYSFAKKVTITLSFDPGALGAGETPSIHCYDKDLGQWINLGGEVSGNTISVEVDHLSKYAVMAAVKLPQPTLSDLAGHWAENSIKELVSLGVINGYPDGTFKPNNKITRAEFAASLVRAFKLDARSGKVFADTAGHWAQEAIAAAAYYGVVSGYDADTFGPDDPITREQMAAMMVRAAKPAPVTAEITFTDGGTISDWAREAVATAVKNGIISGYPDNTVRPRGRATRAEAVTVIVKALSK